MSLSTTTTPQPVYIYATAYLGPGDASNQKILQYQAASSLTGSIVQNSFQQLAASATAQSFNLATIFSTSATTPLIVTISDITTPGVGFYITTNSGANKIPVGANGFLAFTASSAIALPTVYIDNPSTTSVLNLNFGMIGA